MLLRCPRHFSGNEGLATREADQQRASPEEGREQVKNWREHLRVAAIVANALLVMFLIGSKGWWMSIGFGVPLVVPPVLAILALATRGETRNRPIYRSGRQP
jgi:hypothetical protein